MAPNQGRATLAWLVSLGLVPKQPNGVATRKPSVGQQRSAALWPLSLLPNCLKVRSSDCPSAAQQLTDSLSTAHECCRFPRRFCAHLKHTHCAPQLGQGLLRIPARGNLAASEQEHCKTGCCCTSGSCKQQPWLGQAIPFLAPDTSLVMEPSAKDHIQNPDFFLRGRKSICHKTARLSSKRSTKVTKPEPCPAQSSQMPLATTATHPHAELLWGMAILLRTTGYTPHASEKTSLCP